MHINYSADASTPERKRSLIRPIRGIPWWAVLAIYAIAIVVGMLLSLFTKELGIPFAVVFIICAVACSVFANFDALFTATVMPVIGYTVAYPLFYFLSMVASGQKGSKVAIIKIGIPFVTDVPIMLTALSLAVAVAIVRISLMVVKEGWSSLWIVSIFMKKESAQTSPQNTPEKTSNDKPQRAPSPASTTRTAHTSSSGGSSAKDNKDNHPRQGERTHHETATPRREMDERAGAAAASTSSAASERRSSTPRPRPMAHAQGAAIPRIAHPDGGSAGARTQGYPGQNAGPQRRRRGPLTPEERQRLAAIVAARRQGLDPRDPRVQQEMARRRAAVRTSADGGATPRRPYRPENGSARGERTDARPYPQRGNRPHYSTASGNLGTDDPRMVRRRPALNAAPNTASGRPSYGPTRSNSDGHGYAQQDRGRRATGRPYPDPRRDNAQREPYGNTGGRDRGAANAPRRPYGESRQNSESTRGRSTR